MTLLLPAADQVVRDAVDAMLDGVTRPGAGSDISFATRSSRYRVIHGVLREATDASLVGARFVGWLFDGGPVPRMSETWESDARAVLLDQPRGQIVVSSITRVHVANARAEELETQLGRRVDEDSPPILLQQRSVPSPPVPRIVGRADRAIASDDRHPE